MPEDESSQIPPKLRYITSDVASQIDDALMSSEGGFSIDQLMELAGLACAQTVYACYPPETFPNILVAAGPGNQGGDGLVAARHLTHFGYNVSVWYPKEGKTELFAVSSNVRFLAFRAEPLIPFWTIYKQRLKRQLQNLRVTFVPVDEFIDTLDTSDVVLDAIFGFSFKGEPREPFKEPLETLKNESRMEFEARRKIPPIISVDIPSGWDVNTGNPKGQYFEPQVILSLTAPKTGIRSFTLASEDNSEMAKTVDSSEKVIQAALKPGRHFLGGRFIPEDVEERFNLALPGYVGDSQIVDVTGLEEMSETEAKAKVEVDIKDNIAMAERQKEEGLGVATS